MTVWRRTYRVVDGERIEGTWRPIFIKNGDTYFLTDLFYADGLIDCWEPVTLDGLREKVRSGWVVTTIPEGAQASAHHLASWRFTEPRTWLTGEMLLGEVADEIEWLAGRPDSSQRCQEALQEFRDHPDEERRDALRKAYLAIPAHLRIYVLGDMDAGDEPLVKLMTPMGEEAFERVVTDADHRRALDYFDRRDAVTEDYRARHGADLARETGDGPTVTVPGAVYPGGWPTSPGLEALQIEYPRPIVYSGRHYPSVHHAFWALSVADPGRRQDVLAVENPFRARDAAQALPPTPRWPAVQVAVMADLLRAKFAQHADLADLLVGTGDGRITYVQPDSPFWGAYRTEGRNWLGRLLELVRAELVAQTLSPDEE
jgi:predicted NAD-dependent protein-ADP-ribosyltransferase YbiA (DUF1768 family)